MGSLKRVNQTYESDEPIMHNSIAVIILAGGRSSRMGQDKPLTLLAGKPMIAHVAERLRPQVSALACSANGDVNRLSFLDCPILADQGPNQGEDGPLAGLIAGLEWAHSAGHSHIVTVPTDAPFLPLDLVARLQSAPSLDQAALAISQTGPEPLFVLWPCSALPVMTKRFAQGERGPRTLLELISYQRVEFDAPDDGPDPFFNVNRPDDLAAAEYWIKGW
jgi:molybdopterin-guanine dinucleotide biosynthesis protein A